VEIEGKVALVSGAGSGIGRASAQALAGAGAKLIVSDVDEQAGEATAELIRSAGAEASFVRADVTEESDIERMMAAAQSTFGGLHIVHNNAGILAAGPRFPQTPPERFMRVIDVNLRGVLLATYHAIPLIERSGGGVIVQTASSAALTPHPMHPIYAASKAGVLNFTRSLTHLEEESNIRVNCICPALVRTNLASHAADLMSDSEREPFVRYRERISELPHVTLEAVAEAVLTLVRDDTLNGKACHITAESVEML
jgi:NAD(P)-dependent dehydrogenase (short-subunit alcohol dehydrogenase family)